MKSAPGQLLVLAAAGALANIKDLVAQGVNPSTEGMCHLLSFSLPFEVPSALGSHPLLILSLCAFFLLAASRRLSESREGSFHSERSCTHRGVHFRQNRC